MKTTTRILATGIAVLALGCAEASTTGLGDVVVKEGSSEDTPDFSVGRYEVWVRRVVYDKPIQDPISGVRSSETVEFTVKPFNPNSNLAPIFRVGEREVRRILSGGGQPYRVVEFDPEELVDGNEVVFGLDRPDTNTGFFFDSKKLRTYLR